MIDRSPAHRAASAFDDADYPAYTMARAAAILGVTPEYLRSLDATGLLTPDRSAGGHRRYSRTELTLAARVRGLLDSGLTVLSAACRIAELERDLAITRRRLTEPDLTPHTDGPHSRPAGSAGTT
ncbi:MerR family transcriptional regulator [Saccharopolyspora sp. ASAGF58]|uniref:MerR family transcriptional regulator n=1 Tax=Saccharopolyspora sp. ASAGF58 TaxID=2719023 RepID=UPI00143FF781|nr:MerR family transcriptional regulator [Saccharopolyspora sp. ASAGF58]QIZ38560.1 MerR family transcriptional regulator [Saccharopolyspora sp. ASAGF58]